jgi:uncharacterized membrane protein YfcA
LEWGERAVYSRLDFLPPNTHIPAVFELKTTLLAAFGVLFIGLSKAGFGGGLGMLTTPVCVLAFGAGGKPAAFAVGVILPLLCAGDAFSLYHYWGKWEKRNLHCLIPGVVAGVCVGAQLFNLLTNPQINLCIGIIAVSFVLFQFGKEWVFRAEGAFQPTWALGLPYGLGAGVTSTIAHGAGPVVTMFLVPQRLPKEIYVGTTVLVFTWINWIKVPFFVGNNIINRETLLTSLIYVPLIPLGVWLGVWLNRKMSEKFFLNAVYALTFLTGLQLIFNWNIAALWR